MSAALETHSAVRSAFERSWRAQAAYITSGRKDFAPMAATLHPEIVLEQPSTLPYGGRWRRHEGLREWLAAMDEAWDSVEIHDPQILPLSVPSCSAAAAE